MTPEEIIQEAEKRINSYKPMVNGYSRVLELNNLKLNELNIEQLSKIFQYVIDKFPNIKHIDISDNNLSELPDNLGSLQLETLISNRNNFRRFPNVLKDLTSLKNLRIEENKEALEIPEWIGIFSYLKNLKLDNSQISNIPNSLYELPKILTLSVMGNTQIKTDDLIRLRTTFDSKVKLSEDQATKLDNLLNEALIDEKTKEKFRFLIKQTNDKGLKYFSFQGIEQDTSKLIHRILLKGLQELKKREGNDKLYSLYYETLDAIIYDLSFKRSKL